jgi:O-antigen/teichoic acid export membrane protein
MARYLTQDDYGQYKYVLSLVALLSTVSLSGLSTAVFQSAACGFDGALAEGFWMNLRWSVLMFLGAFLIGGYYLFHGNLMLGLGLLVGGCLSPLIASANLYTSFLAGKKDFTRQALYMGVFGTIIPTLSLIIAGVATKNPLVVTLVYFISNAAVAVYFYCRTIQAYRPDPALKDTEMLSYSKHLSVIGILSGVAGNIDNILVFHFIGPAALAVYTYATGIVDQSRGPLKSLDVMVQARFVPRTAADIGSTMRSKMKWLLLFGLFIMAVYILLAPFLYTLLFPVYLVAVPYSQVYALSLLVFVFGPAGSYLSAKKKVMELYANTVANSLLQIVGLTLGVVLWGLWGLIIARVVVRFAGNSVLYWLYERAVASDLPG